jgi:hypothetical protein
MRLKAQLGNFDKATVSIVLADWNALAELYRAIGLTPIHPATRMTIDDLAIAALLDEATTE